MEGKLAICIQNTKKLPQKHKLLMTHKLSCAVSRVQDVRKVSSNRIMNYYIQAMRQIQEVVI